MGYKIGSFNVCNLGRNAIRERITTIANIIKKENFDIVALQEVLTEARALSNPYDLSQKAERVNPKYVETTIMMLLGNDWDFRWDPAGNKHMHDSRGEGYAFLWNKKKFRLVETQTKTGKRVFDPLMLKAASNLKMRNPYYARFEPVRGGRFEIRLICIHTVDSADPQSELHTLFSDFYTRASDKVYGNNLPHYTFILGDYNAEIVASPQANNHKIEEFFDFSKSRGKPRLMQTIQKELTSLKQTEGYAHSYDHFSYEIDTHQGIGIKAERIDAVAKYTDGDFQKYHSIVSDHIPIIMTIDLKATT